MKKVFLSLATIAFVAAGSLTVTSCGGDDSTTPPVVTPPGGDDNPPVGESAGKITYSGEDYPLDITESAIYVNAQGNVSAFPVVVGQDTITATRWIITSYNGEDAMTSENYYELQLWVPVNGTTVVAPNEAETIYLAGAGVYAGNATTPVDLGQLSGFGVEFNTFVESPAQGQMGQINYTSSLTGANGSVNVEYDGDLDGTYNYTPPTQGAKSARVSFKNSNKTNFKNLKLVKSNQVIDSKNLVKVNK